MPSFARLFCLALQVNVLLALIGFALDGNLVLASPLGNPRKLIGDYTKSEALVKKGFSSKRLLVDSSSKRSGPPSTPSSFIAQNNTTSTTQESNSMSKMASYTASAHRNARTLQNLAAKSGTGDQGQEAVTAMKSLNKDSLGIQSLLVNLGSDKGLKNYDQQNNLETMLKDLVNVNKDALESVYDLVDNDPLLGPLLGPLVYELKCIIDLTLDALENVSDALLNALAPFLKGIVDMAPTTMCQNGITVIGLCV